MLIIKIKNFNMQPISVRTLRPTLFRFCGKCLRSKGKSGSAPPLSGNGGAYWAPLTALATLKIRCDGFWGACTTLERASPGLVELKLPVMPRWAFPECSGDGLLQDSSATAFAFAGPAFPRGCVCG